jgi:hypothetical protein
LHLIDVKFQKTIMDMYSYYPPCRDTLVRIDECPSLSKYGDDRPTLGRYYGEVVILDGDHSEENVMAEVDLVLSWPKLPRAIILHDTGRDGLPGPRAAVRHLQKNWWSALHNETAGPRASRGLTICVADELADYDAAYRILENGT